MRRLRRQRPEVPLHVVIAQVVVGAALLRMDEVGELRRVADEKDRGIVADHVVVAVLGVELERKTARVTSGVGRAQLTGDCREARKRLGPLAFLEQDGLRELRNVFGGLEEAMCTAALRAVSYT